MAKQTALQFFLIGLVGLEIGKGIPTDKQVELHKLFEQAKEMGKQQLANAWDKACEQYIYRDGNLVKVWKDFDKYYNLWKQQ